ncbi:MAG: hypothetical protein AAF962_06260 [Actinomycetota bacterium]
MVKVLVATEEAQGLRHSDTAAAVEGELVYLPFGSCQGAIVVPGDGGSTTGAAPVPMPVVCPTAAVGESCGCHRAFVGMASSRCTTTALVMERGDLTPDDLWTALTDALERQDGPDPMASAREFHEFRLLFRRTLATAEHFPAGTIIERDGTRVSRRAVTEPVAIPIDLVGGDG